MPFLIQKQNRCFVKAAVKIFRRYFFGKRIHMTHLKRKKILFLETILKKKIDCPRS